MSGTSFQRHHLNKENPSLINNTLGSTKKLGGLSVLNNCKSDTTNKFNSLHSNNNNDAINATTPVMKQQRRALGDLINTTGGLSVKKSLNIENRTPLKILSSNRTTPKIKGANKELFTSNTKLSELNQNNINLNEDIEHFHPPPVDTFDDIFEDGKLSDLFVSKNVNFISQLPPVRYNIPSDNLNSTQGIQCDKEWNNYIRKMIKTNRKNEKKALSKMNKQQELPVLKAPTDFNSIIHEIFYN